MKYSAHHWTTSINFLIKNAKWKRSWEKEAMRDKAECNNEKQYCWKSHYHEEKCLWNYKLNNKTSLSSTSVFQPRIRWKSQENTVTSIFFFFQTLHVASPKANQQYWQLNPCDHNVPRVSSKFSLPLPVSVATASV